jgi:hypothetical protein
MFFPCLIDNKHGRVVMKLLTSVSSDDQYSPAAQFALINLNSDDVAVLQCYQHHAQSIAKTACSAFHYIAIFSRICDWLGNPNEGDVEVEDICSYLRKQLNLSDEDWRKVNIGGVVRVPDGFEVPEEYVLWTELPQVRVKCETFCFASLADGSDYYQKTGDIGFRELA